MAYRRRQGISRSSTFKEEIHYPPFDSDDSLFSSASSSSSSSSSSSLAAQAIRASAAHRESSLSSAYAADNLRYKSFAAYEGQSPDNESKSGFWGVLARKAKAIIEDDNIAQQYETAGRTRLKSLNSSAGGQPYQPSENSRKMENPTIRKRLDKITSSLNQLGGTFEKAFEEGRTMVESKTADIIQETRKLQIKRKGDISEAPYQAPEVNNSSWQPLQPQIQTNHETQLKASRDVALATAAKAKLLLRELKTVKADLAFAKERCSQLEEENKIHRENREKGEYRADDDLIRLQLETLLAEKARLANENSIYARENRFLREIVEFHQLTMQDVVYLDEGTEEVTEVYPISSSPGISSLISSPSHSPISPSLSSPVPPPGTDHPPEMSEIFHSASHSEEAFDAALEDEVPPTSTASDQEKNTKTSPDSSV